MTSLHLMLSCWRHFPSVSFKLTTTKYRHSRWISDLHVNNYTVPRYTAWTLLTLSAQTGTDQLAMLVLSVNINQQPSLASRDLSMRETEGDEERHRMLQLKIGSRRIISIVGWARFYYFLILYNPLFSVNNLMSI